MGVNDAHNDIMTFHPPPYPPPSRGRVSFFRPPSMGRERHSASVDGREFFHDAGERSSLFAAAFAACIFFFNIEAM